MTAVNFVTCSKKEDEKAKPKDPKGGQISVY